MPENEYNYAEDLAIDPDQLDEAWLNQPGLYMKYAQAHAQAVLDKDKVWERLKIRRSQLIKEAKETGAGNATLQEAYYRDHKDHIALKDELIQAEYDCSILQGACIAFSNRKAALENMVRLWIAEYYVGPQQPRDIPGGKRVVDMTVQAAVKGAREQRSKLNADIKATESPTKRTRKRS